jgi:hypothetical protein
MIVHAQGHGDFGSAQRGTETGETHECLVRSGRLTNEKTHAGSARWA